MGSYPASQVVNQVARTAHSINYSICMASVPVLTPNLYSEDPLFKGSEKQTWENDLCGIVRVLLDSTRTINSWVCV
jgi:hypothetical protein